MAVPLILAGLFLVAGLAALVTRSWLRRGWGRALTAAILVLIGLVVVLWYLARTDTGHYLAGLEQALLAIAVVIGPLAGIGIGFVLNWSQRLGLALGLAYAVAISVLCVNIM